MAEVIIKGFIILAIGYLVIMVMAAYAPVVP
jgi:hypothetical protein